MDDFPRASLDHNIPLLVTLGIPSDESPHSAALEGTLKDQATLVRSEEAVVESDQARALLGYILDRDASDLPWNGLQDALSKYKFRVRTAARVGGIRGTSHLHFHVQLLIHSCANRHSCYLHVEHGSQKTSSHLSHLSPYTLPSHP